MRKEIITTALLDHIYHLRKTQVVHSGTTFKKKITVTNPSFFIAPQFLKSHKPNDIFEFCYILQGRCVIGLAASFFECQAGDLCFTRRGEEHFEHFRHPNEPYEILWFYSLGENNLRAHIGAYSRNKRYLLKGAIQTKIPFALIKVMDVLRDELQGQRKFWWPAAKGHLLEIFTGIARAMEDEKSKVKTFSLEEKRIMEKQWRGQTIQNLKYYIDAHYIERLTLPGLARQLSLTPRYVSRLFKELYDKGAMEYLLEVRMEKAKDLLRDPHKRISEVSYQVGYENIYHFSRIFKKYHQISPRSFRDKLIASA